MVPCTSVPRAWVHIKKYGCKKNTFISHSSCFRSYSIDVDLPTSINLSMSSMWFWVWYSRSIWVSLQSPRSFRLDPNVCSHWQAMPFKALHGTSSQRQFWRNAQFYHYSHLDLIISQKINLACFLTICLLVLYIEYCF